MVLDAMTLFAFMAHRDSVDIWQDGNPIDYWIDEYGFRCIRYESGRWWRYHLVGNYMEVVSAQTRWYICRNKTRFVK